MASAHGQHRESLKGIIAFLSSPPLEAELRTQADKNFYHIVEHYENSVTTPSSGGYNRLRLLRLIYENAASEKSKDNVLLAFFNAIDLPMKEGIDIDFSIKKIEEGILAKLNGFADYLIDNFFLPC